MRAEVDGLNDLAADERVRAVGNIVYAVDGARHTLDVGELIHIAARLEAVMLEHGKRRVLREHGDIELAGLEDHVVGEVGLVDRDADALG